MQTVDTNEWRDHRSAAYLEAYDAMRAAHRAYLAQRDIYRDMTTRDPGFREAEDAFLAAQADLRLADNAMDDAEREELRPS